MKNYKIHKSRTSVDKLRVSPEMLRNDDGFSIAVTSNQVTIIQTDNQEGTMSCRKRTKKKFSETIQKILDSNTVTITMSIVTVYSLFSADVQELAFAKSADNVFSSLTVLCLFLFSLELLLSFMYKQGYKFSFYFWLDLIATLSLITDIGWIWDSMIGVSNSGNSKNLQNAAKASKAGTQTSRIIRIIRLVRLIRLVKLYKNAFIAMKKKEKNKVHDENNKIELEIRHESNVGKKLSELTMKRVISIVLVMLLLLPFFSIEFYFLPQTSWVFGLSELNSFWNQHAFEQVKNEYISYHIADIRPIIYLAWTNATDAYTWEQGISYTDLRFNEIYYCSQNSLTSIFDIRYDAKLTSLLNLFRTLFIAIILTIGAIYFNKDSEELVIKPIEKIIEKVKKIAKNPINAAESIAKEEAESILEPSTCLCFHTSNTKRNDYEMMIIENTIIKIGILLALGFGEAGSAIIENNIEKNTQSDTLASGNKIVGIFGFCDIRNFTDTTEELQEGVMMFVNEIAQIVHGIVDKYFGAANKNIGDAFLLVWKFTAEEFYLDDELIIRNPESKRAYIVPDLSLLSFLKILAKVNKDPTMLKYRTNPRILQRMPNYEVKMGFGLHLGWAIEGAIGTQFKMDASYLSPHVNIASALEGSTKLYGVPLLISGELFEIFSPPIQNYCRKIDVVKLKGNDKPLSLYTSDCDFSAFVPCKTVNRSKAFYRKKRNFLTQKIFKSEVTTADMFFKSNEISLMRKGFSVEFFEKFKFGLQSYLQGNWSFAKAILEKALEIKSKDGPTLALINYMAEFGFNAPDYWNGSRNLG